MTTSSLDRLLVDLVQDLCDETQAALIAGIDPASGEFPDSFRLPPHLAGHLAHCPACLQLLADLQLPELEDDPEELAAIQQIVAESVERRVRTRIIQFQITTVSPDVVGAARNTDRNTEPLETAIWIKGGQEHIDLIETVLPAGDQTWRLKGTASKKLADPDDAWHVELEVVDTSPRQNRIRDLAWQLTARLDDRELTVTRDALGIWHVDEPLTRAQLTTLTCIVLPSA